MVTVAFRELSKLFSIATKQLGEYSDEFRELFNVISIAIEQPREYSNKFKELSSKCRSG